MSKRADRAFLTACAVIGVLALAFAAYKVDTRPQHPAATPAAVTFPHGTSCRHADPLTGPACVAASDLLDAANQSDAPRMCRHLYPTRLYRLCLRRIAFTEAFSDFQSLSFYVVGATLEERYVARVRVRVVPFEDGKPLLAIVVMTRDHGYWRFVRVLPLPGPGASPSG